jgi:hypothetical protein
MHTNKENIMDQLLRLVKRLNEANLCTERDEFGEFCAKKRPCPVHEPELYVVENIEENNKIEFAIQDECGIKDFVEMSEKEFRELFKRIHPHDWEERERKMFGERPLTTGDAPQVPQPIPVGGKDEKR